jgi:acetoin utilization deacetylase AcuC-like enzyme
MTLLYDDPIFLEHLTGNHPEAPVRLWTVAGHLNSIGLGSACSRPAWEPATTEQLQYVHSCEHIEWIRQVAESGGGQIDADTVVSILEIANEHAGGRVVSVLEGGYNPEALADCVAAHLKVLLAVG